MAKKPTKSPASKKPRAARTTSIKDAKPVRHKAQKKVTRANAPTLHAPKAARSTREVAGSYFTPSQAAAANTPARRKADPRFTKGKPFTVAVSDAIRHHVGTAAALESKRVIAFDARDNALAEKKAAADKADEHAVEAAKLKHSDAIVDIDDLSERIKWHRGQVKEVIDNADAPTFDFMYEMPPQPVKAAKKAKDGGEGAEDEDQTTFADHAEIPEGVDQHLAADINELEALGEEDIQRLRDAGFNTVGDLAKAEDAPESLDGCPALAKWTPVDVANVRRALVKYRGLHRKAAREVEKEAFAQG